MTKNPVEPVWKSLPFIEWIWEYVGSDQHLGHANIIRYAERPFSSVEQMNGEIIRRHNQVVPPMAPYLDLGDLNLGLFPESLALSQALNGDRYISPGNHDRISHAFDRGKHIERFAPIYEAAGWKILPELFRSRLADRDVLVSHYPYDGDSHGKDRHAHLRAVDEGLPIIHGHVHQEFATRGRQFHVGVDVHDFRPVHRSEIEAWLATQA